MSQQGRPRDPESGEQNDWWSQLYDPGSPDTGRARAGDTLDDRYASVRRTVGSAPAPAVPSSRRSDPSREPRPDTGPAPVRDQPAGADGPPDPRAAPDGSWPEPESEPDLEPDLEPDPEPEQAPVPAPRSRPVGGTGVDANPRPGTGPSLRPTHVGDRPPTYDAEPATLPIADPAALAELVPDTVLDGARYGGLTLRAASLRGDSARHRGALRRDALLTARFGSGESALLLVAVAAGGRNATGGHRAAREICHAIGGVTGRSHARLAEDIRADRRGALRSGLQRLTDRCYGRLRAQAAALGVAPEEYTADLRCLLLSADPRCRTRVFFGAGAGGLFRLRSGAWQDIEPEPPGPGLELDPAEPGDPAGPAVPPPAHWPPEPFRFRATVAQRGDTLLLCSPGLAGPLRGEPAFADQLARSWAHRAEPPGLAAFLADVQLRVRGFADDRTAVAVWEA
ncbi:MAG: protein phosphatase 2C domain-containing protein [Streptomyces sp.]|uniref:protein phosphatase 2C domain-containing protein n=1 Tax=Streptomyces sp. TaxID=1931 RepID=UPI003D6C2201